MLRTHYKRYCYIAFTLVMLLISWEYNLSGVALAQGEIPEESIRLRILAHSDSPQDQWIKLKVRDEVILHMRTWVAEPQNIDAAREEVQAYLQSFDQLVGEVLAQYGFNYDYTVELGVVEFPTKIYGSKRYPAGDYEALRVQLGAGKGENWWCVLFPPLCFIDLTTSVTVEPEQKVDEDRTRKPVADDDIEARFFLWEVWQSFTGWLKQLFA